MSSPRVTDYQRLYRRTSITIDILCLVVIPLVLGIVVNYLLAISVFAIIAVVTFFRRRFLDEKAENLGYPAEQTASSQTDGRPIRVMALAAALITAGAIVSLAIHLASGEAFPILLIGCVAAIWFGVAMTAVGQRLGRRSR
jgi:hypothetical protein